MDRLFPISQARRYATDTHMQVEGWFHPLDAEIVFTLGLIQTEAAISGSVGEIGVHHGKLAILLYLMLHTNEKGFCVDVFGKQELNIDRSGRGDEDIFLNNLKKYGIDKNLLHVIKSSSHRVSSDDIVKYVGPVRLFSVDGGHTAELTYNDLVLAENSLAEEGVIILDDFFNNDWPGVSEGGHRFLSERKNRMTVFSISKNKTFICKERHVRFYTDSFRFVLKDRVKKEYEFYGQKVCIVTSPRSRKRRRIESAAAAARRLTCNRSSPRLLSE